MNCVRRAARLFFAHPQNQLSLTFPSFYPEDCVRRAHSKIFGGTTVKGHSHPGNAGHFLHLLGSSTALKILFCTLLALILPRFACAQDTGSISGTVSDNSGAAIVGADVNIADLGGSI